MQLFPQLAVKPSQLLRGHHKAQDAHEAQGADAAQHRSSTLLGGVCHPVTHRGGFAMLFSHNSCRG